MNMHNNSDTLMRITPTTVRLWASVSFCIALGFDLLFFNQLIGINAPMMTILVVLFFGICLHMIDARNMTRRFWVSAACMIVASSALVWRDSDVLVLLNGACWLLGFIGILQPQETFATTLNRLFTPMHAIVFPAAQVFSMVASFSTEPEAKQQRRQILRGVILSLPLLVIFVALFASADAIFGETVKQILRYFDQPEFLWHAVLLILITLLTLGLFAIAFANRVMQLKYVQSFLFTARRVTQFPLTEISVVLLVLNAVFALFLLSHIGYLFLAGDSLSSIAESSAYIQQQNTTYAEHARSGFFQLLVAAGFATLLVLLLEKYRRFQTITVQKNQGRRLEVVSMLLLAQVFLVDLSAAGRLWMYVDAYGLTELRFYSLIGIPVIALIIGVLIWVLWKEQRLLFLIQGTVAIFAATVLLLNISNPDAMIARYNIALFGGGSGKLDGAYLRTLSLDAAPVLLTAEEPITTELNKVPGRYYYGTENMKYEQEVKRDIDSRMNPSRKPRISGLFGFNYRFPSWHYAAWKAEQLLPEMIEYETPTAQPSLHKSGTDWD